QAGALAALDDTEHVARTRRNNREGLHFFENAFREWPLRFVPSAANFILVQVATSRGAGAHAGPGAGQRVCDELQRLGVIVRPMAGYQLPDWIRITVGTPTENARCLAALRKVLNQS